MRSSPTTWRCFAGTASTPSAPRSRRRRSTPARRRTPTATSCCASSSPAARSRADQLRTIGRLSERYGRSMGDITTRQNIQLHWLAIEDMPVVLDELNAAGLSFTQACGDVWRNIVGCPLAGVDGHELIDSRPLIRGARRAVCGRPPVLESAAQVQGVGVGLHPRLRPARDQRRRRWSRSRRTARSATTCGSAAGSARRRAWVAGWTSSSGRTRPARCARRSPRSTATRATAPSGHGPGSSSSWMSGESSGCAPRSRPSLVAAWRRRSLRARRSIRTAITSAFIHRTPPGSTTWARPRCGGGSRPIR